jgi:hypothetical protein
MKRIILLSASMLLIFKAAVAQPDTEESKEIKKESRTERIALRRLEGKEVSNISKSSFNIEFPKANNVIWNRSDNFDEATFTDEKGITFTAFYDASGNLVGTTRYVKFEDVPAKGQQEIKKKYKDYTIGKVLFFDDNEANDSDMILWASQFEDADNYFVELTKDKEDLVVKVDTEGGLSFFTELKK